MLCMTSGVNSTVGDRLAKAASLLRAVLHFALMLECLVKLDHSDYMSSAGGCKFMESTNVQA
eukprot:654760-Pelagomonas_calceolata.AAC.1